jgi:hypothetical protein
MAKKQFQKMVKELKDPSLPRLSLFHFRLWHLKGGRHRLPTVHNCSYFRPFIGLILGSGNTPNLSPFLPLISVLYSHLFIVINFSILKDSFLSIFPHSIYIIHILPLSPTSVWIPWGLTRERSNDHSSEIYGNHTLVHYYGSPYGRPFRVFLWVL